MKKFLTYTLLGVLLAGCAGSGREPLETVVDKALAGAERQTLLMAEKYSAREGRLPRTWENGEDVSSDSRWWCSGFFPGVLWYVYENGRNPRVLEYARMFTARVEREKHTTDNHDVGFMLYCSFGNGLRLTGDKSYEEVLLTGARSLATRFKPEVGLIRSWDHNRDKWQYPVIIDNMMNLEMLFWASKHTGDPVYRDVAVRHADITMKNHFRDDASSFHVVSYNDDGTVESRGTFQGYSDSSAWARGQAWGLYGYTMCYRETGDAKYLKHAERIADFIMHHPNTPADRIPYWDYNAPDIPDAPRDASAAAVVSSALFELSTLVPEADGKRYFDYAETLLMNLSSDAYLARKGANGGFILMHSVGHLPADSEIDTPLNYADYYYLEAIGRYLSLRGLDPRRI